MKDAANKPRGSGNRNVSFPEFEKVSNDLMFARVKFPRT